MMNSSSKNSFYQRRFAQEWQPQPGDRPRIEAIRRLVGRGKVVLDVGCYDGQISELVARDGNDVYGVDISTEAVSMARTRGIKAERADIDSGLPFADDFFDTVIAGEVIEHVFDTDRFLHEIHRVLKDGGELVLTTANLASMGRRVLLFMGKNPYIEINLTEEGVGGHVRYFVRESLYQLLRSHGFEPVNFCSDVVNYTRSGKYYSTMLARLFPSWGRILIVKAKLTRKE